MPTDVVMIIAKFKYFHKYSSKINLDFLAPTLLTISRFYLNNNFVLKYTYNTLNIRFFSFFMSIKIIKQFKR